MSSYERNTVTYDEVKVILAKLPDDALRRLAQGPFPRHPSVEKCRVCLTLQDYARLPGVEDLIDWHDYVSRHFAMIGSIAGGKFEHDIEDQLLDEVGGMVGELSFARCLVIYSHAEAELEKRERQRMEEPGEASERDAERDAVQEAAERRLDSEKAGDL